MNRCQEIRIPIYMSQIAHRLERQTSSEVRHNLCSVKNFAPEFR